MANHTGRNSGCPVFEGVKVKLKLTLEQATKIQRGSRGIAVLLL
jgi:hypothetical protein